MPDPMNPKLSGPDLLEQILRECPNLTRDEVLQIAASAGFDLMDLRRNPNSPPALSSETRSRRKRPAESKLRMKRAKPKIAHIESPISDRKPTLPLRLPEQRRTRDPLPERLVRGWLQRRGK